MIKKYFENYFEKIKATKKVARDKNIGVWWMPVFDSFLITIYFSWQLSVGVWIALDAWQSGQDYVPWYMDSLWEISSFSLTIFMSIITFTVLDKIILFFIYVHSYANKLVLQGITKLDMYLWRKTGRDTVVTNFIWKLQRKYMSRSKKEKKIISTMGCIGENSKYTAMAKTVGLPLGISCLMILNNKISSLGVQTPVNKEIYTPVLEELKIFGISFNEIYL